VHLFYLWDEKNVIWFLVSGGIGYCFHGINFTVLLRYEYAGIFLDCFTKIRVFSLRTLNYRLDMLKFLKMEEWKLSFWPNIKEGLINWLLNLVALIYFIHVVKMD